MALVTTHAPRGSLIGSAVAPVRAFARQVLRRRQFDRLLDLDDRMLNDIGVTRGEVLHASRQPLSVNAGLELRRMSVARRRATTKARGDIN